MADIARALISKIVDTNDITTAVRLGVRADWFEDSEHKAVFKWMVDFHQRYGDVPTEVTLKAEYPNFKLVHADEPYEYYTDQFREMHKRSLIVDTILDAHDEIEKYSDVQAAHARLSKGIQLIGQEITALVDENAAGRDNIKSRYDKYEENRRGAGEMTGVPTGFPTFDGLTGGYQPQQFILFGGAQTQGKSFMLMKSAIAAHDYGKKILFLSFEMSAYEQLCRYDAMCCGINASHLLRGTLGDVEMSKLKKQMALRKNMEPFIISSDISAMTTVSALASKIEEHRPDVVYVDGVYLMDNEVGAKPFSTEAYTSISRSLKRLTQRIDIPLIGTTQALSSKMGKGKEVTMHSLGWTSAWAQDADIIFGVEKVENADMLVVRVAGGRNVPMAEVGVSCNWAESYFEETELDG